MADPLNNAAPVGGVGGFPQRSPHDLPRRQTPAQPEPKDRPAADQVAVRGPEQIARQMLRERVLARTREQLELGTGDNVPTFSEVVDDESIGAFLGRLLGAQNQLAALRAQRWPAATIRARLDRGLRDGTAEVLQMLDDGEHGEVAAAVVAEVLAEYGRRLLRLAGESDVDSG